MADSEPPKDYSAPKQAAGGEQQGEQQQWTEEQIKQYYAYYGQQAYPQMGGYGQDQQGIAGQNQEGANQGQYGQPPTSSFERKPSTGACFKCGQEGHMSRECPQGGGGGGGGGPQPGSWDCPQCGANNFPRRWSCFRCQARKPGDTGPPGGGGRGGGGGGACFKCGQEGHMSRECPQGGGGGGGGGGFRGGGAPPMPTGPRPQCSVYITGLPQTVTEAELKEYFARIGIVKINKKTGEDMVKVYRDASGNPKGDAMVTYDDAEAAQGAINWFNGQDFQGSKIGVELVQSQTPAVPVGAPAAPSPMGFGGGGGRGRGGGGACFKCGQEGHMSRECPQGGGGRGGGRGGGGACFKCGQEGHMSRECPQGGGGGRPCYNCGQPGHQARDCTVPKGMGGGGQRGPPQGRSGDWTCPDIACGNINFAHRDRCNKCGMNKPMTYGGNDRSDRSNRDYGRSRDRDRGRPYDRDRDRDRRDDRDRDHHDRGRDDRDYRDSRDR